MSPSEVSVSKGRSAELSIEDDDHREVRTLFTSKSATYTNQNNKRPSRRKSINGLVIEFDWENEEELALWGECDDYIDELHDSALFRSWKEEDVQEEEAQEDFRTRLEAVEIEVPTCTIACNFDDAHFCLRKKLMEALEDKQCPMIIEETSSSDIFSEEQVSHRKTSSIRKSSSTSARRRTSSIRKSVNGHVIEYGDWLVSDSSDDDDSIVNDEIWL